MNGVHESQHPLVKEKLTILRDPATPPKTFRAVMRSLTTLRMYEATRDLKIEPVSVITPLQAKAQGVRLADRVGLVPILRAGLGMVDGALDLLPDAQVWHIGLYRDEETLRPVTYYNKLPRKPRVDVCFVLDPMLATGGSAVATVSILKEWGVERVAFVGILAAPEGVDHLQSHHPDTAIYVAHVDDHLTPPPQRPDDPPAGFIVPGLGDAGDRLFGTEPQ